MAEVSERAGGAGPRPGLRPRRPARPRRGPRAPRPLPGARGRAAALLPSGPEGRWAPSAAAPGPPSRLPHRGRQCACVAWGGGGVGWGGGCGGGEGVRARGFPLPRPPPPAPAPRLLTSRSTVSLRTPTHQTLARWTSARWPPLPPRQRGSPSRVALPPDPSPLTPSPPPPRH